MPPKRNRSASPPRARVRQRVQRACAPCRKRRVKCDGSEPCAVCTGYGYQCQYSTQPASQRSEADKPSDKSPDRDSAVLPESHQPQSSRTLAEREAEPYLATETIVEPDHMIFLHQFIKTRFSSSASAIAFPAKLGHSLELPDPPQLEAFGWNPGIRSESRFRPSKTICEIITIDEMRVYAEKYFKCINVYFGMLEEELFDQCATEFWASSGEHGTDFEAIICGVAALGSFFLGPEGSASEAEIVEHGRVLLDLSIAHPPALLSIKHVIAWNLRVLYLRSTTRPHLSWMASAISVHVAEAIGLHRHIGDKGTTYNLFKLTPSLYKVFREQIFWVTMALNQYLSAEYGRTRSHINLINCQSLSPRPAPDVTAYTVSLLQSASLKQSLDETTVIELFESLNNAMSISIELPLHRLLRADVCFSLYRVLYSKSIALSSVQITNLLEVIETALAGTKSLIASNEPWWNIVSTPFNCVCVLLALHSSSSLAMVIHAMLTLRDVALHYNTDRSIEALRTASALVEGAHAKMSRDLQHLKDGLATVRDQPLPRLQNPTQEPLSFALREGDGLALDRYLDFENSHVLGNSSLWPLTSNQSLGKN